MRPLNVIFVNVRFQKRFVDIIKDMEAQATIVEQYKQNIVYMVSHMDETEDSFKMISEINK
jgi:hypothetical protein